jgi:hypothetical protein
VVVAGEGGELASIVSASGVVQRERRRLGA